ncbi:hypothetical protein F2Q69_00043094 [Brassica cretica]|uniref:Arabidopsis retrotransposon Orf1 C-terminal domain-containing protein n=1 Tax=Brassica cretica TaxID=69181 RepID=A0A8S9NE95_BRACR|nr:hypothetical protein F2Q69_00043094 [Brassica cretica]
MATVNVYYTNERAKRANMGILTSFIRGIRYTVPLSAISTIYGFQNGELQHAVVPGFAGRSTFLGHMATDFFDSGSALQTDIYHPTLRYFTKVLANTLLCKMEPNKVRVQELTLVYYAPHQPEAALPPFPPMPDMSTRPEGDFQRVVVDALTAIWARVSRCRCSIRKSVRASSPLPAGPSRQRRGDFEETTDETTDED